MLQEEAESLLISHLNPTNLSAHTNDGYASSMSSIENLSRISTNTARQQNGVSSASSHHMSSTPTPLQKLRQAEKQGSQRALVVDGSTLNLIMEGNLQKDFLCLAEQCSSVMCVRATPFQKAALVSLVKKELKKQTLAVG